MSNKLRSEIIQKLINNKQYDVVVDYSRIAFGKEIVITEYCCDDIRMFKKGDVVHVLCPKEMSIVQENTLIESISDDEIFKKADDIDNTARYIELKTLPYNAIINKGKTPPKKLRIIISLMLGCIDKENGHPNEIDDASVETSVNMVHDVLKKGSSVSKTLDEYLGHKNIDDSIDDASIRRDIAQIQKEIESINDVSNEDVITDEDFDYLELTFGDNTFDNEYNDDDDYIGEGFMTRRPKKLKQIPRDIIPYITIEMNAIQDTNDQAMLSGYTCAKLELVDFYLNVIDTKDDRYIVPHNRQYLVTMQNELSRLLSQILRIRPINRNDRVWRVNVNYPEDWRG